ncbi:MAG: M20 family metallopeptidase [Acutalibacteraceae bacterium]
MDFYKRALELKKETIAHRRYLHQNAEVGLDMPKAREYVTNKLIEYGLEAMQCGYGVTAVLGKGEKTLLLRADMDALPMPEESGESFACPTGRQAHTCGHDFHTAMLLTAAKMLKENEAKLNGKVKLMFQPAEETFEGSDNMIENGILENPNVDAALAFHVAPGKMPIGLFMYNAGGVMMSSVDGFRITVYGKGGHGAYPNLTVDPIHTAVQIYSALEGLIAREANPEKNCVLTVGKFSGGNAANIIPDKASLEGTLRTNDNQSRELLIRRISELAHKTAEMNGASAEITPLSQVPPLICDRDFTEQIAGFMQEMNIPGITPYPGMQANASEDFAKLAKKVPSAFLYLSAGFSDERGAYSAHNPKVRFNEEVCPIGAAAYAHCAVRFLEANA